MVVPGDLNQDGGVNLLDLDPFVDILPTVGFKLKPISITTPCTYWTLISLLLCSASRPDYQGGRWRCQATRIP